MRLILLALIASAISGQDAKFEEPEHEDDSIEMEGGNIVFEFPNCTGTDGQLGVDSDCKQSVVGT